MVSYILGAMTVVGLLVLVAILEHRFHFKEKLRLMEENIASRISLEMNTVHQRISEVKAKVDAIGPGIDNKVIEIKDHAELIAHGIRVYTSKEINGANLVNDGLTAVTEIKKHITDEVNRIVH